MTKSRSEKKELDGNSLLLVVTIILLFVMHVTDIIMLGGRGLAEVQNFLNLFIFNAGLIVVIIGMTTVMITGDIDISVGSVVATVCMMLVWTMERGNIGTFSAILIVLVTGCIFGLVQGLLVAYLKTQPLIMTLAGMFFTRGMTSIVSQEMISITNEAFAGIATLKIYLPFGGYLNKKGVTIYPHVYPSTIIALVVLVIVFAVLRYTEFDRPICAIGGNEQFALLLGLNARKIELQVYVLDGFLAGLGGLLFRINTYSGPTEQARGSEMDTVASSVTGGTLLTGGVGNVTGSLFRILIKDTIESFVAFRGTFSSWWVRTTIAALLCFFTVPQSLITSPKKKNK